MLPTAAECCEEEGGREEKRRRKLMGVKTERKEKRSQGVLLGVLITAACFVGRVMRGYFFRGERSGNVLSDKKEEPSDPILPHIPLVTSSEDAWETQNGSE